MSFEVKEKAKTTHIPALLLPNNKPRQIVVQYLSHSCKNVRWTECHEVISQMFACIYYCEVGLMRWGRHFVIFFNFTFLVF